MEQYGRSEDLTTLVVNPGSFLPNLPLDKVRLLLLELQSMREDYTRDVVIGYIASNYSSNKHLCTTVLNGKHDREIRDIMDIIEDMINEELEARKTNGLPTY